MYLPAGVREDRDRSVVFNNACPTTDCARGVPITRVVFDRDDDVQYRVYWRWYWCRCCWYWWSACADAASALSMRRRRRSADRLLKIKPVVSAGATAASPAAAAASASVGECAAAACLRARVRVWARQRSLALRCCGRRGDGARKLTSSWVFGDDELRRRRTLFITLCIMPYTHVSTCVRSICTLNNNYTIRTVNERPKLPFRFWLGK